MNPVKLPCEHMFCYLCIKGVAARRGRCAMCRRDIPPGYFEQPDVVNKEVIKSKMDQARNKYHWFYEAKNGGWWMYEERTSSEIEKAYSEKKSSLRIQISGFFYVVDFERMVQCREDIPTRRRNIKRDVERSNAVKGVAGIYLGGGGGSDGRNARSAGRQQDSLVAGETNIATTSELGELVTGFK